MEGNNFKSLYSVQVQLIFNNIFFKSQLLFKILNMSCSNWYVNFENFFIS